MAGTARFTLAQLSDLHLPTTGGLGLRHWTVKRFLGYLNWHWRRKQAFGLEAVDALLADMAVQDPDHVAVTGDLVNLGLPSELAAASDFLRRLGPPEKVTVVPGNHDIYARLRQDPGVGRWRDYMLSDRFGRQQLGDARVRGDGFPFVRKRGPVALIGLNSSLPTPPFIAAGQLGEEQLGVLDTLLNKLGESGHTRVVLIHHPPLQCLASRRRGLLDAAAMEGVLARRGAELVLHGHNHTNTLVWARGPTGGIPVVGIAAGGMISMAGGAHLLARYNILSFLEEAGACRIELVGRGLREPDGPVVELERRCLASDGELTKAAAER